MTSVSLTTTCTSSSISQISKVSDALWLEIVQYLDSLKNFVRFWIVSNLFKTIPKTHHTFWVALVEAFLMSRRLTLEEIRGHLNREELVGFHLLEYLFSNRKCSRSGCYKIYFEWQNIGCTPCMFHPGKMKPNGILSCCRGKGFKSPGCKAGNHNGFIFSMARLSRRLTDKSDKNGGSVQSNVITDGLGDNSFLPCIDIPSYFVDKVNRVDTIRAGTTATTKDRCFSQQQQNTSLPLLK